MPLKGLWDVIFLSNLQLKLWLKKQLDKIGCAIRKGIKIAEVPPKVDESQLNNFGNKQNIKVFQHFPRIIKELI